MRMCGKKTEVYSRVTGYFRPVKNWNAGKQEEFRNRRYFSLSPNREISSDEIFKEDQPLENPAHALKKAGACGCS